MEALRKKRAIFAFLVYKRFVLKSNRRYWLHPLKLFSLPDNTHRDPLSILQYIFENNLTSTLPNVSISLRTLPTLPVSVASGERSFSKLKIIKNYLRSTMLQERLSALAILAIEQEIFDGINFSDVINEFATAKSRKISL